jgi:hypothetical protein
MREEIENIEFWVDVMKVMEKWSGRKIIEKERPTIDHLLCNFHNMLNTCSNDERLALYQKATGIVSGSLRTDAYAIIAGFCQHALWTNFRDHFQWPMHEDYAKLFLPEETVTIYGFSDIGTLVEKFNRWKEVQAQPLNGLAFYPLAHSKDRPLVLGEGCFVHPVPQFTVPFSLCDCGYAVAETNTNAVILCQVGPEGTRLEKQARVIGFFDPATKFDGRLAGQCLMGEVMRRPIADFHLEVPESSRQENRDYRGVEW